jgi:hypothetical protein
MAEYRVGQILYIIPAETANVIPVLVIERRISETSSGIMIKHVVKSPKSKAQPMILETIKGLIFADLRSAREMMIRNATQAIDAMVKHAQNIAQQVFQPSQEHQQATSNILDDPFDTTNILSTNNSSQQLNDEQRVLPAVKPAYTPTDVDEAGVSEVMLPDGQMQRVRLKISN